MANERRSATIMTNVAALTSDPGPIVPHYVITLDTGALYKWIPADTTTAEGLNVLAHTGGTSGRWHRVRWDDKGTDLTDADEDVAIAGKRVRYIAASTLGANRTKELQSDAAAAGDIIRIVRLDTEAFTVAIDDEASASTIFTFPVSVARWAEFRFDGTNWELFGAGAMV